MALPALMVPAQISWHGPSPLQPRSRHAMASDPVSGEAFLFGGAQGTPPQQELRFADTWVLRGGIRWNRFLTSAAPAERAGHAMASDTGRRRVVLFGGTPASGPAFQDTWEWDGAAWQLRAPAVSPSPRSQHAMAYDSGRGRVVLFGGLDGPSNQLVGDTWEWDGTQWQQMTPARSPPARRWHAMAFDAARARVVLVGGASGITWGDTWTWDGTNWTRSNTSAPAARSRHSLCYDATRRQCVLFGGVLSAGGRTAETWLWDGTNWSLASPATAPTPRSDHASSFATALGKVVVQGGSIPALINPDQRDAWLWDGTNWSQLLAAVPQGRTDHALAHDIARGRTVLFGGDVGGALGDTWEWDGSEWILPPVGNGPPARSQHALAYDRARGRTVLFGGWDTSLTRLNDTWEWDGTTWTQASPAVAPAARRGHALAWDSVRQRVVLFGGNTATADQNDTWEWDGTNWLQPTTTVAPPGRYGHALAFDAARGRVVLFGGYLPWGDTWEWDGMQWTALFPAVSPQARSWHGMAYDAARARVVLFAGWSTVALDDLWEWDGRIWIRRILASRPQARLGALVYDPARRRCVAAAGAGGAWLADIWELVNTMPADFAPLGPGCPGSRGLATVTATSGAGPWLGEPFALELRNLPATSAALLLIGSSSTAWGGIPLPVDLGPAGMPGCALRNSVALAVALANAGGAAPWSVPIPPASELVGTGFHVQGVITDPPANPAGAVMSDAATAIFGAK